ncbi:hypothetical protein [Clostridium sp. DSM 8431]|uniref:hypothetical protein n=1 Tax=Clostridium sp. DSM 8431 TaxID=1761781 RepID=UPI001FA8D53D|nr:hypothetical protein [Clostridium sp. DSM 8431]
MIKAFLYLKRGLKKKLYQYKNNLDFIENYRMLDEDLDRRVGVEIQRDKYKKFNLLDKINEAIVV